MVALGCRLPSNLPSVGGTPQNTSLHLRFPAMFHLPANITVVVIKVVCGGREATVQPDEDWLTAVDATNAMLVLWPDTLGWGSILRVCPPRRKRQKKENLHASVSCQDAAAAVGGTQIHKANTAHARTVACAFARACQWVCGLFEWLPLTSYI